MSCPRCGRETAPALAFCDGCGAPLALGAEPAPRALDANLALDRREPGRTPPPIPGPAARAPARPAAAAKGPPLAAPFTAPVPAPLAATVTAPVAAERSHWDLGPALAAEPEVAAPAARDPLDLPDAEVDAVEIHLRRATSGRRALAWAIDLVPFAVAAVLLARALLAQAAAPLGALGPDGLLDLLAREAGILGPVAALLVLALFVYTSLAHALAGATLGKWIARVRVAGPDGRHPSLGRSAARSALAVLSVALLGLGLLAALFTRSGRALHDLGASTWVVEA